MTRRFVLLLMAGIVGLGAHITAQEKKETANVAGTWILEVETSAGSGTPTFTFKQDGEKLEGTYEGTFGTAKVNGTVKGNNITFGFKADAQGTAIEVVYEGIVEKDTMKGTVKLGELGEGTFTGARKK
jgi:hypothetical protein